MYICLLRAKYKAFFSRVSGLNDAEAEMAVLAALWDHCRMSRVRYQGVVL